MIMTLFIFTCNQLMAYTPQCNTEEGALETILNNKKHKIKPLRKKRLIKKIEKELNKTTLLSIDEQENLARKNFYKSYDRVEKTIKKILKKRILLSKLARKMKLSYLEAKSQFQEVLTNRYKKESYKKYIEEINSFGSYEKYLQNQIDILTQENLVTSTKHMKNRSPASVKGTVKDFFTYMLFITLYLSPLVFVTCLILAVFGVSVAAPIFIASGVLAPVGILFFLVAVGMGSIVG